MGEWISVKDRFPEEEQEVLLYTEEIETYGRHCERKKYTTMYIVGTLMEKNGLRVIAMVANTFSR